MPFIKAKNGNVVELAEDLVEEFLAQGHAGPFTTEAAAAAGSVDVDEEPEQSGDEHAAEPTEPKGNGSREDWAAWADHLGVEYAPEAKRDDIRDAVSEALADAE